MGRYLYSTYEKSDLPRYLAVFGLQWQLLDCSRLEAGVDLAAAMQAAVDAMQLAGWRAESTFDYGFVFLCRGAERCLLMLTARDPHDRRAQSFDPFSAQR